MAGLTWFGELAERELATFPEVARKKMFTADALRWSGKVYAMDCRDELVVKLPADRVAQLVAAGEGHPFDRGDGRPMKQWVVLPHADAETGAAYAEEARAFVAEALTQA